MSSLLLVLRYVKSSVDIVSSCRLLILFPAVGCADLAPPPNAWLKRTDDRCEVGCPFTGEQWVLTCVANEWTGHLGRCDHIPRQQTFTDDIVNKVITFIKSQPLGKS